MASYIHLFFIVIAVSLDGFGVGITYGMRNIRLHVMALFIIMLCSGCLITISMLFGQSIKAFISPATTNILGSMILIGIGLFILFSNYKAKKKHDGEEKLMRKQTPFHHIKKVLEQPQYADQDRSGTINSSEAILLGIALALDAFGAGVGAALLGYPLLLTVILISSMSGLLLYTGMLVGTILANVHFFKKFTNVPPLLLITIGIYNFF
ncbi:MAG TPA: sporulation membrane protein YtaF [Pseudogracilibacillus sp.]|nr:sporulation membrane protein YtaF [Pseudogracilibacillus sp.]